jgi:hypothetical protein
VPQRSKASLEILVLENLGIWGFKPQVGPGAEPRPFSASCESNLRPNGVTHGRVNS